MSAISIIYGFFICLISGIVAHDFFERKNYPAAILLFIAASVCSYAIIKENNKPIFERADIYMTKNGQKFHVYQDCISIRNHDLAPFYAPAKCQKYKLDPAIYSIEIIQKRKITMCELCWKNSSTGNPDD